VRPENVRDVPVGKAQIKCRLDEWVRIIRGNPLSCAALLKAEVTLLKAEVTLPVGVEEGQHRHGYEGRGNRGD